MTIRNSRDKSRNLAHHVSEPTFAQRRARNALRQSLIESLEARNLMAVGPQLIGIQTNSSDLVRSGDFIEAAPRELTFRFSDGQTIDTSTVSSGIRVTRAGGDGTFGLISAATDFGTNGQVEIQLTTISPGQTLTVKVIKSDLQPNVGPRFTIIDLTNITIELNSNATTPTTATQLVNAINASNSPVNNLLTAKINGGFADAKLGGLLPSSGLTVSLSSTTDFGTGGRVAVEFRTASPDQNLTIQIVKADLGLNVPPRIPALVGSILTVTLNSNVTTPTTAIQLQNAINAANSPVQSMVTALIVGGASDTQLGLLTPSGFVASKTTTNDQIVPFTANINDTVRRSNEVTLRFADSLIDDLYRIEVFGFDDPTRGIKGIRNVILGRPSGDFFVPTVAGWW